MPHFTVSQLTDYATALLRAGGLDEAEAQSVARSLVDANLRGHDSHGVMRIPYYLDQVAKGELVPAAEFSVQRETPVIIVADGNWGFGRTQAGSLLERLIAKARVAGVAVGTLVQCGHIGRLGEYCEIAAASGLVAQVMVNTHGNARRVAPPGGTDPRLGTNPIAFGVPNGREPLILDFGTSATAEGKVRVKRIAEQSCPEGWLLDSQGRATCDPATLYGNPPGTIRPFGGDQAYKGFGLGLMVELLSGALSGGPCIRETPVTQLGNCVFMQLFDPAQFGGAEHFAREVHDLATFVRGCPLADGVESITLPGDPERAALAQRLTHGIPIDDGNWRQLVERGNSLGIAPPALA
ncbi:MAG: Ldh family oxidoreductase [Planctomycetia bacterium]|nr:Ldh family oxidoreductase [Planctomycetia bacterium]